MKRIVSIVVFLGMLLSAAAQVPVGKFKSHLPYNGFHSVAVAPDCIYAATNSSIAYMDKDADEMNTWSKIEGLSEVGISDICYAAKEDVLIVAYETSNLDFIHDGKVVNIADIKNKAMQGSKRINKIFVNEGIAYIASAFGVVLVDLHNYLILDTWFTKVGAIQYDVRDIAIYGDQFYLATDKGVFHIDKTSRRLADFTQWNKVETLPDGEYTIVEEAGQRIFAVQHVNHELDSIFVDAGDGWQPAPFSLNAVRSLDAADGLVLVCYWGFVQMYDADNESVYYARWVDDNSIEDARQAVLDGDFIWVADNNNGLARLNRHWGTRKLFTADGPHSEMVYRLAAADDMVAMVSGSNINWGAKYLPSSLSYYYNYDWQTVWYNSFPELKNCYDLVEVAINPRNKTEFYAGSWGYGLFHYQDGVFKKRYDETNSSLHDNGNGKTFVSGIAYDQNNNMWLTNSYSSAPLQVIKSDGNWQAFDLRPYVSGTSTVVDKVLVDSRNYKWLTVPRENKLLVFYDNGTIDNRSDDRITSVNLNTYSNIQTTMINCIAEDKEGEIWIGTDQGIKVVYNPYNAFNNGAYAQNILLEQEGYVQNLLQDEQVTCIAVDGANRKWIGTSKAGAFLMSANGTEELLRFSESNSPMFSNQIFDIAINHVTGEVFFATAKGLISYRGTATAGRETYDEVTVFPNPVREGYDGYISVTGLKDKSFCKIVDSSGRLVWQSYANGGELVWDGKNYAGKKVATGVYFVFSSDENGKKRNVAKILVIK